MRLVTFNILHGLPVKDGVPEPDGNFDHMAGHAVITDPEPFRESIRALGQPDVLALQEVDRHQPRSGLMDQPALAAELLGAENWLFAPSVRGTPGLAHEGAAWVSATTADDVRTDRPETLANVGPRYGVSLISRHPVLEWRTLRLTPSVRSLPLLVPDRPRPRVVRVPDEPRSVIAAVIDGPDGPVTVVTAHLSFVPGFNMKQLRRLRAWLAGMPRPLVLMGDFNLPGKLPARVTNWDQAVRQATYPSMGPRVQFDHVLLDGFQRGDIPAIEATAEVLPLPMSDHCAVIVDIGAKQAPLEQTPTEQAQQDLAQQDLAQQQPRQDDPHGA